MAIRLNKVTRDLNVSISTAVEFLQKKGFTVEENPNTKITEEQFDLLKQEFKSDKDLKLQSERLGKRMMQQEQKPKPVDKPAPAKPVVVETPKVEEKKVAEIKTEVPEDSKPRFKQVGHIDLDKLNQRTAPEKSAVKEKPAKTEKPEAVPEKKEEVPAEPVQEEKPVEVAPAPKVETPKPEIPQPKVEPVEEEEPVEEAPEVEDVFRLKGEEIVSKINVIGQIDLAALNQQTRPKKKSKEERKKERAEKEKLRQDQRKQMKESILKEIRHDDNKRGKDSKEDREGQNAESQGKKKRNRIGGGKVDINNVQSYQGGGKNGRKDEKGQAAQQNGGKKQKDRFKGKVTSHQDVNEEDVARQVKETLARLTNKSKSKGAKYRKEKRELAESRMQELENQELAESKILKLTEFVTANELANMMNISVTQVISTCMSVGIMVSINQRLDAETINLVAEEFGFKTEYVSAEVSQAIVEEADKEEDLQPRAPIVTVMGHVDHGKTSLLDYIRKSNVIAGEAGGITQHIGAYNVKLDDGRRITFLDTPGHEAFTAMRARGAKVTDIAIIIVAADDNVMPQTREAINHAQAAGVPIVFAINKIDKPGANPDKIKEELAAMNMMVEEWGGKYQSQDISAKKGIGVKELMEKVLLEAEMLDLKANPNRRATGSIIESSLDRGRGYLATVLVSNGTLKQGDIVLAGSCFGRVKAMFNERNQKLKEAGPAEPALILGLNGAPAAGDTFHVFETEQEAREIANKREQLQREQGLRTTKMLTLDEVGRRLALGDFHELNIIVKGDVDGSVEALSDSLIKLSTDKIQVNVIHKGVGQISESDVTLAAASDAIIVGFQVRPSTAAAKLAEQEGVDIRKYSIIYDAIEEVKSAMEGMLAPTLKEQVTSTIEVREVFNISKVGMVAGAMVKTGKVKRSDRARLIRDGIVIFTGNINALKRFKDDVKEVGTNFECGISLVACNDIKPGDIIETYEEIEVKQTL